MKEEAAHQHEIIELYDHFYFHVIGLLYFIVVEIVTQQNFPEMSLICFFFISQSHSFLGLLSVIPVEASVE